jgi:hypothetical protein
MHLPKEVLGDLTGVLDQVPLFSSIHYTKPLMTESRSFSTAILGWPIDVHPIGVRTCFQPGVGVGTNSGSDRGNSLNYNYDPEYPVKGLLMFSSQLAFLNT